MNAQEIAKNVEKISDTINTVIYALERINATESSGAITVLESAWRYLDNITNELELEEKSK